MATCTLIPSSLVGGYEIINASNAYYDTSHLYDYAQAVVTNISGEENAYLGGFDFSLIPSGSRVVDLIVKLRADVTVSSAYRPHATLVSGIDGVELSDTIIPNERNSGDSITYEFNLTASIETIMNYANSLCIRFTHYFNYSTSTRYKEYVYIYGAEIIVTYFAIEKNKIIYGNKTLIDLTSDTVTESDVKSGVMFHLPSGMQAIGTLSMNEKFMTRTTTTLSVTDLEKQPDWFVVVPTVDNAGSSPMLAFFLYDGTNTYTASSGSGNIRINQSGGIRWSMSFSNGKLTLTKGSSSSSPAVSTASKYKIYYL